MAEFLLNDFVNFQLSVVEDRASIIVGSALIDDLLGQVLQGFLVPVAQRRLDRDPLLGVMQPLGSFGAREAVCFRLGLIDDALREAIYRIRKFRNDAAHVHGDLSWTTQPWSDHLDALKAIAGGTSVENIASAAPLSLGASTRESFWFRLMCAVVLVQLGKLLRDIGKIKVGSYWKPASIGLAKSD